MVILRKGSKGEEVKALQIKLNKHGINAGVADGIFGDGTLAAVKEFQAIFGLTADGIVGNDTYYVLNTLDAITHFTLDEFRCKCCNKLKLNINLLLKLEELRTKLDNNTMVVTSGYRCPAYNARVGGITNSEHLKGNAADIKVASRSPKEVYDLADKMFRGVGLYNTFTHVDVGVNYYRWDNSTKVWDSIPEVVDPFKSPTFMRKYNTNIWVYSTDVGNKVDMDLGVRGKLETVSTIVKNKLKENEDVLLATNGGFFNFNGSSEHLGLYISKGLYFSPPSADFMEFIYFKDGHTNIVNYTNYDKAELSKLQNIAHWAISTSYSLVINGKVDIRNAEKFSHAGNKEPRTMFGQLADGSFVLVVTDGRTGLSSGLTAHEQAELMLSLGCINACNDDGGGSSEMVAVKNDAPYIVNQLAGGTERAIGSVMIVYQGGWE